MLDTKDNIFWGKSTQRNEEILNAWKSLQSQTVSSKSGIQLSETDQLNTRLGEHPHDSDAWQRLIEIAEHSGNLAQIRDAFDRLLKHYPNTSSAQIRYLGHLVNSSGTVGEAEDLFRQWLKSSPSVDLWRFYLSICKHTNVNPQTQDNVRKAYEFALTHVGQDKDSGGIWEDYLQFLRAGEATTTWEKGQKVDTIRRVYQRAVQIPLENVEQLWQDMQKFENDLNAVTAQKFLADLSPAHMQARSVLRQLNNHLNPLYPQSSNTPGRTEVILPAEPVFSQAERQLLGRWRNYLKWEESNPLELDDSQRATLVARIQLVYRKALIQMRFYPEIWYMAYDWLVGVGKAEEGLAILKAGWETMPRSYLLTFAYAQAMEEKHRYDIVNSIYDAFLAGLRKHLEHLDAKSKAGGAANLLRGPTGGLTVDGGGVPGLGEQPPSQSQQPQSLGLSNKSDGDGSARAKTSDLEMHKYEYGLAIIMYLRFARRAEGVNKHREMFWKFRRDEYCPWQVYEAAALVEYHNASGDKADRENIQIASRIFEKGLELFANEVEYVLSYLGFLISINEENNARALFERVIKSFPPERAKPIWERWARYEYQYGDLGSSGNFDRRLAEVYANDHPIKRFSIRHSYLGIDPIAFRDLGAAMAAKKPTNDSGATSYGKAETQPNNNSGATSRSKAETQTNNHPLCQPTNGQKRPHTLDHGYCKGDDRATGSEYGSGHKRTRLMSPRRGGNHRDHRDRDRHDHWDGPPRRRHSPPPPASGGRDWERERDRHPQGEEERGRYAAQVPQILSWFVGKLPNTKAFDGPVFRINDLMSLFRNAAIPIPSSGPRARSPPHSRQPQLPPDYGPYQGPRSGCRRY